MNRRFRTAAMAMCLPVLTAQAVWAAPVGGWPFANRDKAPKAKKITFHIQNKCTKPLMISSGDQQYTIQPGRSIQLTLDEGTQVTAVNDASHAAAGTVLTTVSTNLQNTTLAIT